MTADTDTGPDQDPPPTIRGDVPMLAYEDGVAAIQFLRAASVSPERMRFTNDDGSIGHAELALATR